MSCQQGNAHLRIALTGCRIHQTCHLLNTFGMLWQVYQQVPVSQIHPKKIWVYLFSYAEVLAAWVRAVSRPNKQQLQYRGFPFEGDNWQAKRFSRNSCGCQHPANPRAYAEPTMSSRVAAALTWPSLLVSRALPSTSSVVEPRQRPSIFAPSQRHLSVQSASEVGKLKSIGDLPGPSLATTLYLLFVKGYADKSHLLQVLFLFILFFISCKKNLSVSVLVFSNVRQ